MFNPTHFTVVFILIILPFFAVCQVNTNSASPGAEWQEALDFHNKVRKDVGTAPLTWSEELAQYAQEWADHLAKNDCAFEHRSGEWKTKKYGENIFWGSGKGYTALDASKSWYSEIGQYVHAPISFENVYSVGHYTQMVWYNTSRVGIGKATCANGSTLIVANYDPPGNYIGQKAYE